VDTKNKAWHDALRIVRFSFREITHLFSSASKVDTFAPHQANSVVVWSLSANLAHLFANGIEYGIYEP
jgi:hypothetical protein